METIVNQSKMVKQEISHNEERAQMLKELHSHNLADRITNMPISENTRAALYFKGKVQDVIDTLFSLHYLIYREPDDKTTEMFCKAGEMLNELADKYIIESISDNIGTRMTEI